MIRRKNFAGEITPRIIDTEYVECNFVQPQPKDTAGVKSGIRIFPGDDTPRTFRRCNLVNCELPPGSTVEGGNQAIIEMDKVIRTFTIRVDGVVVGRHRHVSNFVHGRYKGNELITFPSATEHEGER